MTRASALGPKACRRGLARVARQDHEIGDVPRKREAVGLVGDATRALAEHSRCAEDCPEFLDDARVHQKSMRASRQRATSSSTNAKRREVPIETNAL